MAGSVILIVGQADPTIFAHDILSPVLLGPGFTATEISGVGTFRRQDVS